MSTVQSISARLCAALFILLFCSTAFAGSAKVEVCHIPPSDPDNYHTIRINENALAAHMAHFDLVGSCNALCDDLCDDGNVCTIDHGGDCETNGCYVATVPVDCSDDNLCTDDLCEPDQDQGCYNPVAITCEAPNACVSSTCDPSSGICEETDVICDPGEECNPDSGCQPIGEPDVCPCFTAESLGSAVSCTITTDSTFAFYAAGFTACTGSGCSTLGSPGCSTYDDNLIFTDQTIEADINTLCLAELELVCPQ